MFITAIAEGPLRGVSIMRVELRRFLRSSDGATAIEYAFIAGLVSIGIVGALSAMSGSLTVLFNGVASTLSGASGG
jgi:pilus assembly protein Flp/PilA